MSNTQRSTSGTVGEFWRVHPRLYMSKQVLLGVVEIVFLVISVRVMLLEYEKKCTSEDSEAQVYYLEISYKRFALYLIIALHIFHTIRLIYKICLFSTRMRKKTIKCQGLAQCLIMDCYCFVGTLIYAFTQYTFFWHPLNCFDELPLTNKWMSVEIMYQYAQIAFYLLSNLFVVAILLNT